MRWFEFTGVAFGEQHDRFASSLGRLSSELEEAGELAEALPLREQAYLIQVENHGPSKKSVVDAVRSLINGYENVGDSDKLEYWRPKLEEAN